MTDRYTDKPFLRFVDAYVLKAIGELDDATAKYCTAMEPQLRQSFRTTGNWADIVAREMKFTPDLPSQIQRIWTDGNDRLAAAGEEPLEPVQFAMIFVDRNLPHT